MKYLFVETQLRETVVEASDRDEAWTKFEAWRVHDDGLDVGEGFAELDVEIQNGSDVQELVADV